LAPTGKRKKPRGDSREKTVKRRDLRPTGGIGGALDDIVIKTGGKFVEAQWSTERHGLCMPR
jgi:hypothetical protein